MVGFFLALTLTNEWMRSLKPKVQACFLAPEAELDRMLREFHGVMTSAFGLIGAWGGAHLGYLISGRESSDIRDVFAFIAGTVIGTASTVVATRLAVRRGDAWLS